MGWETFGTSSYDDIKRYWQDDGEGGGRVLSVQNCTPTQELAKAMAGHNDGYNKARDFKRAATVPYTLLYKWIADAGIEPNDPERQAKINQLIIDKVNDSDYRDLRTIPGRAG